MLVTCCHPSSFTDGHIELMSIADTNISIVDAINISAWYLVTFQCSFLNQLALKGCSVKQMFPLRYFL